MNIKFKQKWGLITLLIVAITYLALNLFESRANHNDIVEIYFADRMSVGHKILIDRYNKLNAGKVKVIPVDFPNSDFSTNERKEVLARSLRGHGDGIDVFAVDIIWVQRFAKWCEPLDKYFPQPERNKIVDKALESCYYDGELVAVPLDLVQSIMYYRKDIINKLKNKKEIIQRLNNYITWDSFIKLSSEFPDKKNFYIFPAADYEGLICCFLEQLLSLKSNYFEQNGFNFETPEAEKTLQLFIINKNKISPPSVTEFTEIQSYEYFIHHDSPFIWGWPTYDKDFVEQPYDIKKQDSLVKVPIPHFMDGKPASIIGGWDIMVSKFSTKKAEAIDFIKFLLENSSQEIFYKESAYYPIIKSFYEDSTYLKKYPAIAKYKIWLKSGVHRPADIEYTKFSKIMSYYFNKAIKNEIPVEEALVSCTKAIQLDKVLVQ